MNEEPIEAVDAEALAHLERMALAKDAQREAPVIQKVPVAEGAEVAPDGGVAPRQTLAPEEAARRYPAAPVDPTLTPVWKVGADGKLEALVEATAVDARLAALDRLAQRIEAQVRHTMLLTMALAERFQITAEEYDKSMAMTQRVEQGASR